MVIRKYIIPAIIWLLYRVLSITWRVTVREPEALVKLHQQNSPFILAHWHGDELVLLSLIRRYRVATITSTSKDGESMNTLVKMVGGVTSRGSSTRGGVQALKGLIRLVRAGHNTSFAVDGPRGPIYKVKPGVFEVSRLLRCPIFWVGVACDRAWEFKKTWNKTCLPKPFARVWIEWHGPMAAVSTEVDPRDIHLAQSLEEKLNAAKHEARKKFEVHNA